MININKLLTSKHVEVKVAEITIDRNFVKQFRTNNNLTQVALANILGVTQETVEKWEQGEDRVSGSNAILLKLLNDNPDLLSQLYSVKVVSGEQKDGSMTKSEQIKTEIAKMSTYQLGEFLLLWPGFLKSQGIDSREKIEAWLNTEVKGEE